MISNVPSRLRQLEQATANETGDGEVLDRETAGLRESWLLLGELIRAADGEEAIHAELPVTLADSRRRGGGARQVISAALAGGVVVAMVAVALSWGVRNGNSLDVPADLVRSTTTSDPSTPRKAMVELTAEDLSDISWDDSFDDRVQEARLAIWAARESQRERAPQWQFLQSDFSRLGSELEEGAL